MTNIIRNTLILFACFASSAFASDGSGGSGSFLLTLFIGFFALIVVFQLVPAIVLFFGMLKGLFVRDQETEKRLN